MVKAVVVGGTAAVSTAFAFEEEGEGVVSWAVVESEVVVEGALEFVGLSEEWKDTEIVWWDDDEWWVIVWVRPL